MQEHENSAQLDNSKVSLSVFLISATLHLGRQTTLPVTLWWQRKDKLLPNLQELWMPLEGVRRVKSELRKVRRSST